MTQDERWQSQYDQMMEFMKTNHRRPSKHRIDEAPVYIGANLAKSFLENRLLKATIPQTGLKSLIAC